MTGLRVLHVSTFELAGGAARAANRIHCALRRAGVDSRMLVMHGAGDDPHVLQLAPSHGRLAHRVKSAVSARLLGLQDTPTNEVTHSLNLFDSGWGAWINRSDFDVVNLHWLGAEALSVEEIGRIRKPLCWTLHDMWAFSGAEHYDDLAYPGRFRGGYTPADRPPNARGPDLDAWTWQRKRRAWAGQRFRLVSPSNWLAGCARQSALLAAHECLVIPNCLDTERFKPTQPQAARLALGLDPGKRYILFGAESGAADRRKGFYLLRDAIHKLGGSPAADGTELLVFGSAGAAELDGLALPVHRLGAIRDDERLALMYSAADVFAAPSMQDNLPNTVMEALACGTPCVAFAVGGMPDLISHRATGWLAEPFSVEDFCEGLAYVLHSPSLRSACGIDAVRNYAPAVVAQRYEQLYAGMVAQSVARPAFAVT